MAAFSRHVWLLFLNNLRTTLRYPAFVVLSLFQPACYLLLFAPLLEGLAGSENFPPGGAFDVFTPGLMVMTALYSAAFVGFGVLYALRTGVIERLRVTPMHRLALPLSLLLRDLLILVVQYTILLGVAFVLGVRPHPLGLVLSYVLLILIGLVFASFSYGLALVVKDDGVLASTVNFIALPLILLSGITLPLTLAPPVIRTLAVANPLAHAVDAARALFLGDLGSISVFIGFGVLAVLAAITLRWTVGLFRTATA